MPARQIDAEQKRLVILGDDELETIYGRPHFTHEDRCNYFFLSIPEKELLQDLRSIKSQAYFVLQLNAKIIGANEHESHYVFDILYNNTTDIMAK